VLGMCASPAETTTRRTSGWSQYDRGLLAKKGRLLSVLLSERMAVLPRHAHTSSQSSPVPPLVVRSSAERSARSDRDSLVKHDA
jgi:hypothetical protein